MQDNEFVQQDAVALNLTYMPPADIPKTWAFAAHRLPPNSQKQPTKLLTAFADYRLQ